MRIHLIFCLAIVLPSCYHKRIQDPGLIQPTVASFNDDWEFSIPDNLPTNINLPHSSRIEPLVVNDQWQGTQHYRKTFTVENPQVGKTILHFEGVMHDATVFLNTKEVKRHVGGYLPFSIDLTPHLKSGTNEVKVIVSNQDDSTIPPGKPLSGLDFNYYGGIYRDVWLIRKGLIHMTDPFLENNQDAGWMIHFDNVSKDLATGSLRIQLKNELPSDATVEIIGTLSLQGDSQSFSQGAVLSPSSSEEFEIPIEVNSPQLWSTTTPSLYDLNIKIISQGKLHDEVESRIGIRQIGLSEDGFFLNGEKMFIRGTNRHQEYPYVGYAISNSANFRDALQIKNAGFDFVRLSHYPQDVSFLKACDELGLLVMNAIPGWQHYEEGEFVHNSHQDIRDMVRRDRNHPSVVFWEVSLNESGMTEEYMIKANAILDEELPFEDTYSAGWIDHPSYDLYIPARQHGKPPHYWNLHQEGKRNVFIAEYGDWEYYAHNAGFNQTAFKDLSDEERNSRQLRAHGEKRLLQQALNFQEAANSNRKGISTIGHANWVMFDYNRGYADDLEASGISDIFRIPKFAYYFYKSQRPPNEDIAHPLVEDGPVLKIASHWTENSAPTVRVFSNCEQVGLYLNDRLIAMQEPSVTPFSDHLLHPPFEFSLPQFEAGQLKAVGLINQEIVITDYVQTPDTPTDLKLSVDGISVTSEEKADHLFVYAKVVDSYGNLVPGDTSKVRFVLNADGKLLGKNPVHAEAGIATILFHGDPKTLDVSVYATESKIGPDTYSAASRPIN